MSVNKTGSNKNTAGGGEWDSSTGAALDVTNLNLLFGSPSMASDNRNMPEVEEIKKLMVEGYKALSDSTIPAQQRAIIPKVELISPFISSSLPGLVMYCTAGNQIWAMAALFSTKDNCLQTDTVHMNNPGGMPTKITALIPPTGYFNKEVVENLEKHFKAVSEAEGLKGEPQLINLTVVDYEMQDHPFAGDIKERAARNANYLKGQWESSILTKLCSAVPAQGGKLPSPFKDPSSPYGKDNWAEARVTAVDTQVSKAGTLLPSNMEVVINSTRNPNGSNNNSDQSNSKTIARMKATVQLSAISYQAHCENSMRLLQQGGQSDAVAQFMGMNGGPYPQGYKPFHPVITLDTAQAEELMNFNNGLYPWYFGLYALMCTNSDFIFTEALRRANVGARGNLSGLEGRLELLLQGVFNGARTIMDDKTVLDTDAVNSWIRQNVAANAVFRSNIIPHGLDSAVNKHLEKLSDPNGLNRASAVMAMTAVMDGLSKEKFSELVQRNKIAAANGGKGWTADKPVLHRTKMIAVNGLGKNMEGKYLNTLEVDEMYLGRHKGKAGMKNGLDYLSILYGNTGEEFKSRAQRLRLEQSQSLFDGHVHINTFGMSCVWDPQFLALVAESMQEVGTLQVANTMTTMKPNNMVFMPNGGLQTMAVVGNGLGGGLLTGFGNGTLWG